MMYLNSSILSNIELECKRFRELINDISRRYVFNPVSGMFLEEYRQELNDIIDDTIGKLSGEYKFNFKTDFMGESTRINSEFFLNNTRVKSLCEKEYSDIADYARVVLVMINNGTIQSKFEFMTATHKKLLDYGEDVWEVPF